MIPPIEVPWPPMNLVAECSTMSAPCSIGRHRYGEANVLSMTRGRLFSCAMPATAETAGLNRQNESMSNKFIRGLPMVSA